MNSRRQADDSYIIMRYATSVVGVLVGKLYCSTSVYNNSKPDLHVMDARYHMQVWLFQGGFHATKIKLR